MGSYQVTGLCQQANKPATLDDLKDNIQRDIANVPVEMWSYDRYRILFLKCNACTTRTINLNSISQIFLCFIHK